MTNWLYPTAFSSWRHGDGGAESAAYDRVLASGQLTTGPETKAFEAEMAAYHGRKHAIATNSGSSANLIAVAAAKHLHVNDGNIVYDKAPLEGYAIVPAIAWSTTYAPLLQHRYDLVLHDVDSTWNANPHKILDVRRDYQVIVGCSILGSAGYMQELRLFADRKNAVMIEDNCESFGVWHPGNRLTGTFGHLSTGSGFYSHQLSAVELGWVLTDDDELARLCRLLCDHGNAGWGSEDFSESYKFIVFGYNVRPIEAHCAVAREQLKRQDEFAKERRRNWRMFADLARGLPIQMQEMRGDFNPFGMAFTIECNEEEDDIGRRQWRNRLAKALRAEGVDCRLPTGGSFTRHPYGAPWRDQPTPSADRVHDCGMFLGNAPFPIDEKIERAIKVMRRVLL